MWTKPYGRTGKNVTVVSFGGMRFEKPERIEANAELVLYAHAKGINYFDTAPGYCSDKSEDIMGAAFRHMAPGSFYCSSKCMAADGKAFRASLERSLKRLGVPKIDFFHIWCLVNPQDWPERKAGGAVAAALKARQEGLIGHVVGSAHLSGPHTAEVLDEGVLEGLTIGYNVLNFPFRAEALAAAERLKLGVVTMNPLGGGLIATQAERLAFIRGPKDRSVVEAAIRFNISQPAITSALVGFSAKQQVDEAVAAVEGFQPYPAGHIQAIKQRVGPGMDGLCTMCGYCLPCPADIQIPKLMDAYNHKLMGDKGDKGDQAIRDRLNWHWDLEPKAAENCTDCGECEKRCTQHLPIRERLRQIAELK